MAAGTGSFSFLMVSDPTSWIRRPERRGVGVIFGG